MLAHLHRSQNACAVRLASKEPKPPRFEYPSKATAAMRMRPVATGCQNGETPNRLRPFATTPRRKTPTIVPVMRPRPPPSGAPPTITAAMAVSSYPSAACGVAVAVSPMRMMPDIAAHRDDENVDGKAHARGVDAHLGGRDGIAADGINVVTKTRSMENKSEQGGDDEEEDRRIGNSKETSEPQCGERIRDAKTRGGVGGDINEPAHDRHRPERCDEWIDAEIGDEPAVRCADEETGGDGADDADGNAGRPQVDHERRANDAGKGGYGPDGKIKTAEDDGEGHAAGDDSDDRVLLQDVDEVLIRPEGRRRREHARDEQDEDDQDAMAPGDRREPAPATKVMRRSRPMLAAPVIMLTISSGWVLAVWR